MTRNNPTNDIQARFYNYLDNLWRRK